MECILGCPTLIQPSGKRKRRKKNAPLGKPRMRKSVKLLRMLQLDKILAFVMVWGGVFSIDGLSEVEMGGVGSCFCFLLHDP